MVCCYCDVGSFCVGHVGLSELLYHTYDRFFDIAVERSSFAVPGVFGFLCLVGLICLIVGDRVVLGR